jgi:hypothetical protein
LFHFFIFFSLLKNPSLHEKDKRSSIYFYYLTNNIKNADVDRAGNGTMTTSHTKVHAKSFLVIDELMHGTLSPPAIFNRAWVVTASHEGKISVVTGIIAFITDTRVFDLFIRDLEAMAGGANKCTCITPDTV